MAIIQRRKDDAEKIVEKNTKKLIAISAKMIGKIVRDEPPTGYGYASFSKSPFKWIMKKIFDFRSDRLNLENKELLFWIRSCQKAAEELERGNRGPAIEILQAIYTEYAEYCGGFYCLFSIHYELIKAFSQQT